MPLRIFDKCFGYSNLSALGQSWVCPTAVNGSVMYSQCDFMYFQQFGRPNYCNYGEAALALTLAVISIPANLVAARAFKTSRLELYVLMVALATVNIFAALATLVKYGQSIFTEQWVFGERFCVIFACFLGSLIPLESWIMVFISFERRFSVNSRTLISEQSKSSRYRKVLFVLLALVIANMASVSIMVEVVSVKSYAKAGKALNYCAVEEFQFIPYFSIQLLYTFAAFVMPIIIITANYIHIWRTVRKTALACTGTLRVRRQREINMAYLLAGTVVLFLICTLPIHAVLLNIKLQHDRNEAKTVQSSAYWAAIILNNVYGIANPVILSCMIWKRHMVDWKNSGKSGRKQPISCLFVRDASQASSSTFM